jgi:hypothetical protein
MPTPLPVRISLTKQARGPTTAGSHAHRPRRSSVIGASSRCARWRASSSTPCARLVAGCSTPPRVAALKAKRSLGGAPAAAPEGRVAARVFYLFDHGRELREIVEELEITPAIVRDLWHKWLTDLQEGEINRRKSAQDERRQRAEEAQLRELERRSEQEQKNFETAMAAMAAAAGQGDKR